MEQRQYARLGTTARSTPVNNLEILFPNGYDHNESNSRPLVTVRDTAADDWDYDTADDYQCHSPSENVTVTIKISAGGQGIVTETDKNNMFIREEINYQPADKNLPQNSNDDIADMRQRLLGIGDVEEAQQAVDPETVQDTPNNRREEKTTREKDQIEEQIHLTEGATNNSLPKNAGRKHPVRRQNSLYDEYEQLLVPDSPSTRKKRKPKESSTKPKVSIIRCNNETDASDNSPHHTVEPEEEAEDFMAYLKELRGEHPRHSSNVEETISSEDDDSDFRAYMERLNKYKTDIRQDDDSEDNEHTGGAVGHQPTTRYIFPQNRDLVDISDTIRTSNPVPEDIIHISDEDERVYEFSDQPSYNHLSVEEITISDDEDFSSYPSTFNCNALYKPRKHRGGNVMVDDVHESEEEIAYPGDEVIIENKAVLKRKNGKCDKVALQSSPDESDSESDDEDEKDKSEKDKVDKTKNKNDKDDTSDDEDPNGANGSDNTDNDQSDGNNDPYDEGGYDDSGYDRDDDRHDNEHSDNDDNSGQENEGYFSPGLRSRSSSDQESPKCDCNQNSHANTYITINGEEQPTDKTHIYGCCENETISNHLIDNDEVTLCEQVSDQQRLSEDTHNELYTCNHSDSINNETNRTSGNDLKEKCKSVTILSIGDNGFNQTVPSVHTLDTNTLTQCKCSDVNKCSENAKELEAVADKEHTNHEHTGLTESFSKLDLSGEGLPNTEEAVTYGIVQSPTSSEDCGSFDGAYGVDNGFELIAASTFSPEDKEVFEILDFTECLNSVECHFQTIGDYEVQEIESDSDIRLSNSNTVSQTGSDISFDLLSPPEAFKDNSKPPTADLSNCKITNMVHVNTESDVKNWSSEYVLSSELFRCSSSDIDSHTTAPSNINELETMSVSDCSSASSYCSSVDYEDEFEKAVELCVKETTYSDNVLSADSTEEIGNVVVLNRESNDMNEDLKEKTEFATHLEYANGISCVNTIVDDSEHSNEADLYSETKCETKHNADLENTVVKDKLEKNTEMHLEEDVNSFILKRENNTNDPDINIYVQSHNQEGNEKMEEPKPDNEMKAMLRCEENDNTKQHSRTLADDCHRHTVDTYLQNTEVEEHNENAVSEAIKHSRFGENIDSDDGTKVHNVSQTTDKYINVKEKENSLQEDDFDADKDIAEYCNGNIVDQEDEAASDDENKHCITEQAHVITNKPRTKIYDKVEETLMKWNLKRRPRVISYFVPYIIENKPVPKFNLRKLNSIKRICIVRKELLCGKRKNIAKNDVNDGPDITTDAETVSDEFEDLRRKCEMLDNGLDHKTSEEQSPGDIMKLGFGFYILGAGENLNLPMGPRLKKSDNTCDPNRRSTYFRGRYMPSHNK